ncbi:hypothetical protein Bca101_087806 [Brassica carinata]
MYHDQLALSLCSAHSQRALLLVLTTITSSSSDKQGSTSNAPSTVTYPSSPPLATLKEKY